MVNCSTLLYYLGYSNRTYLEAENSAIVLTFSALERNEISSIQVLFYSFTAAWTAYYSTAFIFVTLWTIRANFRFYIIPRSCENMIGICSVEIYYFRNFIQHELSENLHNTIGQTCAANNFQHCKTRVHFPPDVPVPNTIIYLLGLLIWWDHMNS